MQTPVVSSSFIPKRPVVETRRRRSYQNALLIISVSAVVLALGAWGGFMVYGRTLENERTRLKATLAEKARTIDFQFVSQIEALDSQLATAAELLNRHIDLEQLFYFLESVTLRDSIRFSSFKYGVATDGKPTVELQGKARNFLSLGYQARVLEESKGISHIEFSNFTIDDKTGDIGFGLTFAVDDAMLSYANHFKDLPQEAATTTSGESVPNNDTP